MRISLSMVYIYYEINIENRYTHKVYCTGQPVVIETGELPPAESVVHTLTEEKRTSCVVFLAACRRGSANDL